MQKSSEAPLHPWMQIKNAQTRKSVKSIQEVQVDNNQVPFSLSDKGTNAKKVT